MSEPISEASHDLIKAQMLFAENNLPFPPIPTKFAPNIVEVADWIYGNRTEETYLYETNDFIRSSLMYQEDDYILFGHSGRGYNSWAIHYYLVEGPLSLFIQVGWGGALDDEEANASTTSALGQFFNDAARLIQAVEEAQQKGYFKSGEKLIVEASTFNGYRWLRLENVATENLSNSSLQWHEDDEKILQHLSENLDV